MSGVLTGLCLFMSKRYELSKGINKNCLKIVFCYFSDFSHDAEDHEHFNMSEFYLAMPARELTRFDVVQVKKKLNKLLRLIYHAKFLGALKTSHRIPYSCGLKL